jgi:hypothetical protein
VCPFWPVLIMGHYQSRRTERLFSLRSDRNGRDRRKWPEARAGGGLRERSEAERTDKINQAAPGATGRSEGAGGRGRRPSLSTSNQIRQAVRGGCGGPKGRSPPRQTIRVLIIFLSPLYLNQTLYASSSLHILLSSYSFLLAMR